MVSQTEIGSLQHKSAVSRRKLADPSTPFIFNAWYVAGRSDEIGRTLMHRTILGRGLLFYRKEDGRVAALQNRCGHRSFPLSEGKLTGDEVVCRYHGLRYGSDGVCRALPDGSAPRGKFGIRDYPTHEQAGLVWIWMGDQEAATSTPVPHPEWLGGAGWEFSVGYVLARGNYIHLHENLLDLSHLTYLHERTFGTPEYARAPVEIKVSEDAIEVWRNVECVLPPIYAVPLKWEGARALRQSGSRLISPGLHVNTGIFTNLDAGPQPEPQPMVKFAQLLTPETATTTHYHFAAARNFALADTSMGEHILAGAREAFAEDLFALERVSALQHASEQAGDFYEFDIPTDKAGVEMRRRFKKMADAERGPVQEQVDKRLYSSPDPARGTNNE